MLVVSLPLPLSRPAGVNFRLPPSSVSRLPKQTDWWPFYGVGSSFMGAFFAMEFVSLRLQSPSTEHQQDRDASKEKRGSRSVSRMVPSKTLQFFFTSPHYCLRIPQQPGPKLTPHSGQIHAI